MRRGKSIHTRNCNGFTIVDSRVQCRHGICMNNNKVMTPTLETRISYQIWVKMRTERFPISEVEKNVREWKEIFMSANYFGVRKSSRYFDTFAFSLSFPDIFGLGCIFVCIFDRVMSFVNVCILHSRHNSPHGYNLQKQSPTVRINNFACYDNRT